MALLRSHAPQRTRAHGEWVAARTVALQVALADGCRHYTVRPVGRLRRWRWYAVTPHYLDGADTPVAVEHEGRAWTKRGARRTARWAADPHRLMQEALRDRAHLGLSPRAARVVRATTTLIHATYVLCAVALVACIAALLAHWPGYDTLINVSFCAFAVPGILLRLGLRFYLARHAAPAVEEVS